MAAVAKKVVAIKVRKADALGKIPTATTGSAGDHSRPLHDYILQFVAAELERIGAK